MKIRVEEKSEYGQVPEVIIRCNHKNNEVNEIVELLETKYKKMIGSLKQQEHVLKPSDILYCESVDGVTYAYTNKEVYKTWYTLNELEQTYAVMGYFRASKSVVINIHAIESLKSEIGNRIDACLENGEHIIISRRYAKALRTILKGGEEE